MIAKCLLTIALLFCLVSVGQAQTSKCVAPSTTGTQLFGYNGQRNYFAVCDNDPAVLAYVCLGGTAAACVGGGGIPLQAGGGCWEAPCVIPHTTGTACVSPESIYVVFGSVSSNQICGLQY